MLLIKRAVIVGMGGIGAALATALADRGVQVTALSRSQTALDQRFIPRTIDVEDEQSIRRAAEEVGARGTLDLVLVASGLLQDASTAAEKSHRQLSAETLQRYFLVNATGPALVAKHFLPLLHINKPAVFGALSARVGSVSDNRLGGWYGYRASKAALNMIIKTLAIEQARTRPHSVCVALHPGTVDTPLSKPFQRGVAADRLFSPSASAAHLLNVIANLRHADSGSCFAWDGSKIDP
jgi:NAD(P)-dependent dehydrogenase (short-subunit alcohol dehydrogenase family)